MKLCCSTLAIISIVLSYCLLSADGQLEEEEIYHNLSKQKPQQHHVAQSRIVGGDAVAAVGDYSFHVTWHYKLDQFPSCGGSLVAPNLVLTAAHCHKISGGVRVGSYYATGGGEEENDNVVTRRVVDKILHPNFQSDGSFQYDFMILELDSPVDTTKYTPIPLNFDPDIPFAGDMLTVIGFGRIEEGGDPSEVLQEVSVPANSDKTCRSQYGSTTIQKKVQLCAGYPQGGKDACQGDSGGPLFVRNNNNEITLVGIVSSGSGCARPNKSGIYSRVSGVQEWLRQEICSRSRNPAPAYCSREFIPPSVSPTTALPTNSPTVPLPLDLANVIHSYTALFGSSAPTNFPTAQPTTNFPTIEGCVLCDDNEAPWMILQNIQCASSPELLQRTCNQNFYWQDKKICQQSCASAGYGYPDDNCCRTHASSSSTTTTTSSPSPAPSQSPNTNNPDDNCVFCNDVGSEWMIYVGMECPSSYILASKCNLSTSWNANNYCRQSCYFAGRGYSGDVCCRPTEGTQQLDEEVADPLFTTTTVTTSSPLSPEPTTFATTSSPVSLEPTTSATTSSPVSPEPSNSPSSRYGSLDDLTDLLAMNDGVLFEFIETEQDITSKPTFLPSQSPSSSPTTVPSIKPTIAPSIQPVVPINTCTPCTNVGNQWMQDNNVTCDDDEASILIQRKCNNNDQWIADKYCQYTCYEAGNGYSGDSCCARALTTRPPTPPPTTSAPVAIIISPTDNDNCTICDDVGTEWMIYVGMECQYSYILHQCNANTAWSEERHCRQSCYFAGHGYAGDVCCPPPPTPNPTPDPTPLPTPHPTSKPTPKPNTPEPNTPKPTPNPIEPTISLSTNQPVVTTTTSTIAPSSQPVKPRPTANACPTGPATYHPGDLTVRLGGGLASGTLLASTGLNGRVLTRVGHRVRLNEGRSESSVLMHGAADGAATFPDDNDSGKYYLVSNSETRTGGVGILHLDATKTPHDVIGYRQTAQNTGTGWRNCGGGRTPWGTWLTSEESGNGLVYEVDPNDATPGRSNYCLSPIVPAEGGNYESNAAWASSSDNKYHFYTTNDSGSDYRLTRFIPDNDIDAMLAKRRKLDRLCGASGALSYLKLICTRDCRSSYPSGTYTWEATRAYERFDQPYPNAEGIDVKGDEMYFVTKGQKRLYIVDLAGSTWTSTSTVPSDNNFSPDQIARITGSNSPDDLLYFADDGSGTRDILARGMDDRGRYRFFTIIQGYTSTETTGLTFSPDNKYMYFAHQGQSEIWQIWREDGCTFGNGVYLDVNYHAFVSRYLRY